MTDYFFNSPRTKTKPSSWTCFRICVELDLWL